MTAYLTAVAAALAPAGPAFHRDLDSFGPGREIYERNTALAADRVRELIATASPRVASATCTRRWSPTPSPR